MICSFGAILAWKSDAADAANADDDDADDDYDKDRTQKWLIIKYYFCEQIKWCNN